jgi:hypothetical protein
MPRTPQRQQTSITRRRIPARPARPAPQRRVSYERPERITTAEADALQKAFDHFNRELFGGQLPDVLFTYQRHAGMLGHFAPNHFSSRTGGTRKPHNIALNPDGFVGKSDEFICSVLTHEQAHEKDYVELPASTATPTSPPTTHSSTAGTPCSSDPTQR